MLASESRLYNAPGVFDWAEIDPRRQITTQTQEDVLIKLHEARPNTLLYGFGFEVVNRGGSIPSGTVALPNLPATGLPKNFQTSEQTFWDRAAAFSTHATTCAAKASRLRSVASLGGSISRAQLPSPTQAFFGPLGVRVSPSPANTTVKTRFSLRGKRSAVTSCSGPWTTPGRNTCSCDTASARRD